ncbi:hypothetical protein TorRG33x02_355850, partial [Trema orientale]
MWVWEEVGFGPLHKTLPRSTAHSSPSSSNSVLTSNCGEQKTVLVISLILQLGISPEGSASRNGLSLNSARIESDSTKKSNLLVRTEEYVAPEIISGDGHDYAYLNK